MLLHYLLLSKWFGSANTDIPQRALLPLVVTMA